MLVCFLQRIYKLTTRYNYVLFFLVCAAYLFLLMKRLICKFLQEKKLVFNSLATLKLPNQFVYLWLNLLGFFGKIFLKKYGLCLII